METKYSKVFAKKLVALFLSVLMALSCFTGALSAYAASVDSDKDFHDANLASNFMAWAETSDEQTCEALLDWADMHLKDLMEGLLGDSHISLYYNAVVLTIDINGYLDSVDGIFDLLNQVDNLLSGTIKTLAGGDIKNINLDPVGSDLSPIADASKTMSGCGKAYRAKYSAKELILALARFLEVNSNDVDGKNVIGNFLKGSLNLGSIITGILKDDVYGLLQGALGMWDGYEWNLVYNIVANLILENTKWFDADTLAAYKSDIRATSASNRSYKFNFDDVLMTALSEKLLGEIHVEITYPNRVQIQEKNELTGEMENKWVNDSSVKRYERICKELGISKTDEIDQTSSKFVAAAKNDAAAHNYTYDPSVIYFTNSTKDNAATANMDSETGCVFLFQKRNGNSVEKIKLEKSDNLFDFAFRALKFAWDTALEPTLGLVHVNYDVNRGYGANYDNKFYYWMTEDSKHTWDYTNWKSNYSAANVEAWAEANYDNKDYYNGDVEVASSPEEFLNIVKHTYSYDRSIVADPKNNWQDINPSTLFNKLRYNPLADLYFDMQTGPINLYFEQTGIDPISKFFDTAFTSYDNMVAGLNDALVSVTELIFLDSDNIGYQTTGSTDNESPAEALSVPTMKKTGNTIDNNTIASTLISNVVTMFEYAANVTDANILNPYYTKHNITTKSGNLSEGVFEEAMLPLLIACLQEVSMTKPIHDEKWDSCKDAEGVAIVALEEYLSYVLPDKDYSVLWTKDADGYIVAKSGQNLFENTIMPMARDALGYIIASVVPCRTADGKEWNVYDSNPTDSTTIFEILNSVMCYYASQDNFSDGTSGKAVATLLGVVDSNNNPLVSMKNNIWTNLDHIVNTLLPFIGVFQYGTVASYGKASSEDLIYNDLIKGILDIGTPKANGDMGVTNILKKLITIITADPIKSNKATPHDTGASLDEMIYNVLADMLNTLLGSRTDTRYATLVPYAEYYDTDAYSDTKSSTPFDSLLATSTIGHFSNGDGKDTGMLGMLIYNIFKAFGGNSTTTGNNKTTGTQGCWTGAMFAVEAVNNFIPSFCQSLGDHTLNTATAEVANASQSGLSAGSSFTATTIDITNNSIGLNRFYRDANGNVQRRPRYFVYVRDIKQSSDTGATVSIASYDHVIQPEKTLRVGISGTTPANATTYTFDVEYAIFEAEMNGTTKPSFNESKVVAGCSNLHTTAYMYLTTEVDWASTVYDSNGHYAVTYYTGTNDNNKSNAYTHTSPKYGGSNVRFGGAVLLPTFPNDFIVPMSNAQSINNKCFYVKNVSNSVVGQAKAFDGVYATLMVGDQYYAVNGTTIAETLTTAGTGSTDEEKSFGISNKFVGYAAIDTTNGDILNYNRWDYTTDDGKTWNRGPLIFDDFACGYSQSELNSLTDAAAVKAKEEGTFGTRTHVAWTLDEAIAHGVVKGVQRTKSKIVDGKASYIYSGVLLDLSTSYMTKKVTVNGSEESISTKLLKGGSDPYESITWGTPTPGIYFAAYKTEVAAGGESWCTFLNYDGSTNLNVDSYPMGIFLYTTSNQYMTGKVNVHIADDSASTDLKREYSSALNTYSTYSKSDVKEVSAYDNVATALKSAVKTISTPINTTNAASLGSTMETVAKTNSDTSTVGDLAYKPIPTTTDIDATIQLGATKGYGSDGVEYWFYNKECTIPISSKTKLAATDVTTLSGKTVLKANNALEVTLEEDGYHYVNTPQYEYDWALPAQTGYATPYKQATTTQVTDKSGKLVYNRISFTCYDENGKSMDSRGDWTYIIADRNSVIKENDGNDYRGVYQKDIDNLKYYIEQLKKNVNTEVANVIHENVTLDRQGLNNVNFEVASYEKMVQVAKDVEGLIWSEKDGDPTYYVINEAGTAKIPVVKSSQSRPGNTLYEDAQGNTYPDSKVKTDQKYKYLTDKSLTQLNAGVALYNDYKGYVVDRGYIGDKLEAEINCATNYDYTALDYTKETEPATDIDGNEYTKVTAAAITSTSATDAKYGTWENGTLVNKKADGTQAYTEASWNNYLIALANGVEIADAKTEKVSATYEAKKQIQLAENNLEEFVEDAGSDMITVSGKVTIATNVDGTEGTTGIVDLTVATADGEYTVQTAEDGSFELSVPIGTTELVISGHSAIARTVTLSGTADVSGVVIPVNICDYVKNNKVDLYDTTQFNKVMNGDYDIYYDLVKNGKVDLYDLTMFNKFVNQNIVYAELALD